MRCIALAKTAVGVQQRSSAQAVVVSPENHYERGRETRDKSEQQREADMEENIRAARVRRALLVIPRNECALRVPYCVCSLRE